MSHHIPRSRGIKLGKLVSPPPYLTPPPLEYICRHTSQNWRRHHALTRVEPRSAWYLPTTLRVKDLTPDQYVPFFMSIVALVGRDLSKIVGNDLLNVVPL